MKLVLGCGKAPKEGWVNVDKTPIHEDAIQCDLDVIPWPWADNSVGEIIMDSCLEHLNDLTITLTELYRIMKHDATLRILIPHGQGYGAFYPGHKLFFSYWTFFAIANSHEWEPWNFKIESYRVAYFEGYNVPILDWSGSKFPTIMERLLWIKPESIYVTLSAQKANRPELSKHVRVSRESEENHE